MPARKGSEALVIVDPALDELGPRMLALTPLQRRFVIGWLNNKGKDASRVARVAGYSQQDDSSRAIAYQLLRHPKIVKAIHEEAGRRLEGLTAVAIFALERNVNSSNAKARQAAIDSILDRTGFPRRTERSLDVTDVRQQHNHEQLLTMVSERLRVLVSQEPKLIENAQYTEMEDVANGDGDAGVQDERARDSSKVDAPKRVAKKRGAP